MSAGQRRINVGLTRHVSAGSYLQTVLVWAISTVVATRLFLAATGYPQLGGGVLHIAHVLWGGLLMLAALAIVLASLGNTARRLAAATGGIGFGLFIDELGKFITRDVDYFYQPAIAMIYLVFVALFLGFRAVERGTLTPETLHANAANEVTELILDGASRSEVERAVGLLDRSGATGPLAAGLRAAIAGAVAAPDRPPSLLARFNERLWRRYHAIVGHGGYRGVVAALFAVHGAASVIVTAAVVTGALPNQAWTDPIVLLGAGPLSRVGIISSVVSLAMVVAGTALLPRSRLAAYRWFERSLLVSLFVTQVALFWQSQLAATLVLAWNLVLLGGLGAAIRQEARERATRREP